MKPKPVRSMRSRSPDRAALVSALTTSPLVGLACVPPGEVPASTSVLTRCGALQRELLGDHAAHREAEHVRALDLERVEQRDRVGGEIGGRDTAVAGAALADAAVVVGDDLEVALELAQERLAPVRAVAAHPLDQQQRLAVAAALDMQLASGDGHSRHRRNATGCKMRQMTDTLDVLDRGRLLSFSFDDLMKYHGPGSPGGVAQAFKILERAPAAARPRRPLRAARDRSPHGVRRSRRTRRVRARDARGDGRSLRRRPVARAARARPHDGALRLRADVPRAHA